MARVVAATSGTFYGQAMTAGDIYTVAGGGGQGFFGDGGPGTSAWVGLPEGVAVDSAGKCTDRRQRHRPHPGGSRLTGPVLSTPGALPAPAVAQARRPVLSAAGSRRRGW